MINMLVMYWLPAQEQDIVVELSGGPTVRSRLDTEKLTYSVRSGKQWVARELGELFSEERRARLAVVESLVATALKKE